MQNFVIWINSLLIFSLLAARKRAETKEKYHFKEIENTINIFTQFKYNNSIFLAYKLLEKDEKR